MRPQIVRPVWRPVRDEEAGDVPKAFVVPREGDVIDPHEATAAAGRVAFRRPLRACLVQRALAGRASQVRA
jgi:hypothetical protein